MYTILNKRVSHKELCDVVLSCIVPAVLPLKFQLLAGIFPGLAKLYWQLEEKQASDLLCAG